MASCRNCGAELGVGRFCTNCGARIAPAAPATAPPPPSYPPPPPFRPGPAPAPAPGESRHRDDRAFSPWLVAVLVLALAGSAALGTWLATAGSDDDSQGSTASGSATTGTTSADAATSPAPTAPGANDVSTTATVTGPRPIPPGVDLDNNRVAYPADNMVDDDPESAYRLPGDASGSVITFQLSDVTTISQVGMVNGYTKVDTSGASTVDWYPLNRRVVRVEWAFDDGTTVEQALDPEVRELQLIEVDDIETSSVQLTILEVSPPGTGPGARDVTPISDVLLLGT